MPETAITMPAILGVLDLAAIATFALSGALLAVQLRQTFVTVAFFALVTGVGGGSVRDLLIGAPVFWVRDPWVATVCLAVATVVWFTPHRWWDGKPLEWADAVGLGIYPVVGTVKALAYGVAPVPAMMMGVVTGCVGGIIRDVLAGRPSILMRPELYVTAAVLGSTLTAAGSVLGLDGRPLWAFAAIAGFTLRGAAIHWGIALPTYGRNRQEPDH